MSDPASDPSNRILNLILAYCRSQGLGVVTRLGIPDLLVDGPKSADALATTTGCNADYLSRVMRALSVEGVFERNDDGTFSQSELSACMTTDHPRSLRWLASSMCDTAHWQPWAKAYETVLQGKCQTEPVLGGNCWTYLGEHPDEAERFGRAMSAMSNQATLAIGENYDFSRFEHIVDVGGSHGTLLLDLLGRCDARGTVFDLPGVVEIARRNVEASPLAGRIELVGGSFFDSVPADGDAYLLKHILHDWPDAECERILRNIRDAIRDDGRLLVFDALLVPEAPPWAIWLDVHMMMLQDGRERSPDEFAALFARCGFELVEARPIPSPVAIVEARPV